LGRGKYNRKTNYIQGVMMEKACASLVIMLLAMVAPVSAFDDPVILVSDNEADLSVAAAVADQLGLATVVTPWGGYRESVLGQIKELEPNLVWIVGEYMAVPMEYREQLRELGIEFEVLGGDTRQQTSLIMYNNFRNRIDLRPLICDGSLPITTDETIPVYVFNDVDEIEDFVNRNMDLVRIVSYGRARQVAEAISGIEVVGITPEMIDESHELVEEIRRLGERGYLSGQRISEIMSEHGKVIQELMTIGMSVVCPNCGAVLKIVPPPPGAVVAQVITPLPCPVCSAIVYEAPTAGYKLEAIEISQTKITKEQAIAIANETEEIQKYLKLLQGKSGSGK
jgi:putative cell wall-binding protein